jgi:hypothetical protein
VAQEQTTLNTMERPLSTDTKSTTALHDPPVPVRAKLAAAWTSLMFLYIYVDYLALYKPGVIDDILVGVVHEFDTGPTFVALALTLMAIPSLMILLSTTLPARVNRATNLVVATLYIPASMYNADGESWTYSYFYGLSIGLELLLLAFILRSAWTWPRTPAPSMPEPAAPRRSPAGRQRDRPRPTRKRRGRVRRPERCRQVHHDPHAARTDHADRW